MLRENFAILFFCSLTFLRIDHILCTGVYFPLLSHDDGSPLDEIQTNIVLLPDSGGRARRDVVALPESQNLPESSDPPESQDSTDRDLSRGYTQSSSDKFLNDVDISEDAIQNTIRSKNISMKNESDNTKYYKTEFFEDGMRYFVNLDTVNSTGPHQGKVKEHSMLSKSYRRAATINLKFRFPFYGHEVENITIATGGFLYTGDYVHSWLAATQYIAPLMANFDTSNNHNAKIRYLDTGDSLTVEWRDVYLQEREQEGPFTFQVVLNNSGDIYFAYSEIPLAITTIQDEEHPVKVGLSDAYIIDRTIFFVRRKTIYEYHRVNMKHENISSHSAIVFKALFTCNQQKTCSDCLDKRSSPLSSNCGWCPTLNRCSDGMDRNRQDWLTNNCDKNNISQLEQCFMSTQVVTPADNPEISGDQAARSADMAFNSAKEPSISPGGLTAVIFFVLLIVTVFGWVGYAYFFPHTWSGQLLIKYRPGAWRWRQGGARYTAASIHM